MTFNAPNKARLPVLKPLAFACLSALICGMASPLLAQDPDQTEEALLEEVVVTGYRRSLEVAPQRTPDDGP